MYLRLFYFSKSPSYLQYLRNNFLLKSLKISASSCFPTKNSTSSSLSICCSLKGLFSGLFACLWPWGFHLPAPGIYSPASSNCDGFLTGCSLRFLSHLLKLCSSKCGSLTSRAPCPRFRGGACQKCRIQGLTYKLLSELYSFTRSPVDLCVY